MRESRQRARWLAFALALPPLLLLSHDIVGFGRIPNYTGFLTQIATPEGASLNPVDLLIRRAHWQPNTSRAARAVHLGIIAALCVPMYNRGLTLMEGMVENAACDPLVGQAIVHEIHDDYMLRRLTAFPGEFWLLRPLWKALKHVPFDQPLSLATGRQIE